MTSPGLPWGSSGPSFDLNGASSYPQVADAADTASPLVPDADHVARPRVLPAFASVKGRATSDTETRSAWSLLEEEATVNEATEAEVDL